VTDHDFDAFKREFQRLSAALERTFRQTPEELTARIDAYFVVLKKLPLGVVIAKADAWLERESKMPKPAEWAAVAPKRLVVDLPTLTPAEAEEWLDAESRMWEREPCECVSCVHAGVSTLPQRFVPELDAYDRDVRALIGSRPQPITRGHWAHGDELGRYWRAREEFWHRMKQLFPGLKLTNQGALTADETPRHQRKDAEFVQVGR
jgi:hypothetical protein